MFGLFVVIPLLGTHPSWIRRLGGRRLVRLEAWTATQFRVVPEMDPLAAELYQIRRREKLLADVARLQRILATDEAMSATRQLGNRIAYDWLVAELERARSLPRTPVPETFSDSWSTGPLSIQPSAPTYAAADQPGGSTVEVLDIGWR